MARNVARLALYRLGCPTVGGSAPRIHRPRGPRAPLKIDIVLSTDRCLMSDYHGHEFLGFLATGPVLLPPKKLWVELACPPVKVDRHGRPFQAPYGLRKLEAKLQEEGFEAHVVDPDFVPYYVTHGARGLLVGHHDYFAMGPPSNEWWMITGRKPVNAGSFEEFISFPEIWWAKKMHGLKVVVGGPAAWQWLVDPAKLAKWPVDTVVEGEAERVIVELAERIVDGDELPRHVLVGPRDSPSVEEIPEIRSASINGLVEIMRGCPRGCRFCSVTFRPLRMMPLDRVEREIAVNLRAGVRNVIFHSEDVLLYGGDGVRPNPEPLLRLHELVVKHGLGLAWSHASLAAVKYGEEKHRLISRLSEMLIDGENRRFIGVEVGIETGSPRLARMVMPAKSAPYPPEMWPDIVEEAFAIMHDNNIVPAATFILGLPGEKPEDVVKTVELLERLRPYRSMVVPMFFVPLGWLADRKGFTKELLREEHIEALKAALRHTLHWADKMLSEYLGSTNSPATRMLLRLFLKAVELKARRAEKLVEQKLRR